MRVVALLTVRNEERYLARCLEHLCSQGIETCLIDNGSTDSTLEIARSFLSRGVFRIEHLPFNGCFELEKILLNEERLATEIDADWFIHHDADEIREAPRPYKTLKEGIEDADRQGYNAINFDEFVFMPTSEDESFEGKDYVKEMRYYYFFEPHPLRRVNAWKKTANIDLHSNAGHRIEFAGRKRFPTGFILRHYMVLSKSHALQKYSRIYSKNRIKTWGQNERTLFKPQWLNFPAKARLKKLDDSGNNWDKSDPWKIHTFLTGNSKENAQPQNWQIWTNSQLSDKLLETQDIPSLPPMPMIVGNPRSGTTLLRLMLDAHPDLAIPPETHFIPALFQLKGDSHQLRESFHKQLTAAPRWPNFHLSADSFYTHLVNIEPFTISAGLRCFYQTYAKRLGKSRWGDKTPPYVFHIHDIQTVLPEAHFIHIIRDGRDVALSMKKMWWGAGDDIEKQAINWVWRIREARQQAQFCQHYLEVRYEELIANPTKVLQDICAFINLPYNSQMEDYYKSAESRLHEFNSRYNPDGTLLAKKYQLSIHSLTSQPPDQSRIGRWKREMSNGDRDKYEQIAGAILRDLGYETGEMLKQLTLSHPLLLDFGPNIIGSTGGSGTRVVARIVRRGGMFMGTKLNGSEDAIDFGQYSSRWIDTFMAVRSSFLPLAIETEMLQELQTILARHLADLDLSKKSQSWGWKESRSIFLLPFFHKHFPQMKFLHILRDGRDMAYSHNQNQLRKHGSTLLEPSEQQQWSQPLQSIALWSRLHLLAAEYGEQNMPGQYLRIRFEDLCFKPVATIQQIFNFFGLSGDIQKIAQEEVSPPNSIGRWRNGETETLMELHRIGATALKKFGYSISEEFLPPAKAREDVGSQDAKDLLASEPQAKPEKLAKSSPFDLQQIQADLDRSHSRLSQIKAELEQT